MPDKHYPYKIPAQPLVFGQYPEMPWKKKKTLWQKIRLLFRRWFK
jgi:hypothetical protein